MIKIFWTLSNLADLLLVSWNATIIHRDNRCTTGHSTERNDTHSILARSHRFLSTRLQLTPILPSHSLILSSIIGRTEETIIAALFPLLFHAVKFQKRAQTHNGSLFLTTVSCIGVWFDVAGETVAAAAIVERFGRWGALPLFEAIGMGSWSVCLHDSQLLDFDDLRSS